MRLTKSQSLRCDYMYVQITRPLEWDSKVNKALKKYDIDPVTKTNSGPLANPEIRFLFWLNLNEADPIISDVSF